MGVHLEDDEVTEEIKKVDLEQDEGSERADTNVPITSRNYHHKSMKSCEIIRRRSSSRSGDSTAHLPRPKGERPRPTPFLIGPPSSYTSFSLATLFSL